MIDILLFQFLYSDSSDEGFLSVEWMTNAVEVAITYVLVVVVVLFQIHIPENYRNIYNERFNSSLYIFLLNQIAIVLLLFFISNPKVYMGMANLITSQIISDVPKTFYSSFGLSVKDISEGIIALSIFAIIAFTIFYRGFMFLIYNIKSVRNYAEKLSEKIADSVIKKLYQKEALFEKDLNDLNILARVLEGGQAKTQFLEQCERIIEHILATSYKSEYPTLLTRLLDEVVCLSITYDGTQANRENRHKALQIFKLVHNYSFQRQEPKHRTRWRRWIKKVKSYCSSKTGGAYFPIGYDAKREDEYRKTIIGYFTKEVGIAAIQKSDFESVGEAIEQLYTIDADPNELFSLGNRANDLGDTSSTVAVHKKLTSKIHKAFREERDLSKEELRTIYFWLGLLARIYQKGGSARVFAERQWEPMEELLSQENRSTQPRAVFDATYKHFYRLTDFVTADAVKKLEKIFFP